jgi:hypothetical protein
MNRAAARLRVLYPNDGDQARLVEETGLHQSYVSRLYRGERVPSARVRLLFWERSERIPMHWWDEEVPPDHVETDLPLEARPPPPMPDDDEPTAPELPALLAPRRQSSFPPPPLADAVTPDSEPTAVDVAPPEPTPTPRSALPPVALRSRTKRDREATDPDPRAGDVIEPTPKPLTVFDVRIDTPSPDGEA